MPRERFELVLSRLGGFKGQLYFHLKGEPLLHPLLGDFLSLAGGQGHRVSLTTNGTLVGERATTLLGAPALGKLSISLHSHSGSMDLARYWEGIASFLDLHRERPTFPVSLRLWNRDSGRLPPETEALWDLVRARYPGAGDWDSVMSGGRSIRLEEKVYLNPADRFEWPGLGLPQSETRGFCHALGNQAGILVDGRVVPCCLDGEGDLALGNILESDLEAILDSPRARAIKEGFARGELVEGLCRTCGYRRRFPPRTGLGARGAPP